MVRFVNNYVDKNFRHPAGCGAMPAARYGWDSPAWKAGLAAALRTAQARGLTADIYIGPYWPAVAAGIEPCPSVAPLTYSRRSGELRVTPA
jgi:hypothetical protein